uniref:Uncharacterized protein TCIL3000_6_3170 n=1 Tax=Trypanosoma congolense (strain IL3000) TaxID=1068625 RepID=G0UNV6_TRYCI|nr:unnamed protein product [Trypanosoma congolense IL3000]
MLSIVHRILSCPVSRVGERLVVVPVSKISEELTLSEETVETVLFMMLSLDRDVLSACHGISPTGYKVIRTSAAVSEADVMQKAGKRKRGEAQAPGVGSTLAQLNVLDDVFEMFLKNKRIECVVTAANGLNMSLHDLDFRMNDLCDTGFVALQRLSPGYVISVGKKFVEAATPLGQQQLASRLWNLHNTRIENLVKSLALTFGVLQRPTHDGVEFGLQYSPSIVPDSLPTQYREAMCWTPPVRSVTKVEAVMIVNDFVEKNRPRINNTYEAARALLGVLPKNLAGRGKYSGEIPLAMCWYVSSPFFGLLREFDMQWILKLLSPHNLDGNVSTSSS